MARKVIISLTIAQATALLAAAESMLAGEPDTGDAAGVSFNALGNAVLALHTAKRAALRCDCDCGDGRELVKLPCGCSCHHGR